MDFSEIIQIKNKKFWWMDVVFYFVISLLVTTVFCFLVFYVKNSFLREDINKQEEALKTVGTDSQKEREEEVILYQGKIRDFSYLLENHKFASNVFAFMEDQTMPNVWFKQFNLDEKNNGVQLSGEAEDTDAFARQVAIFEKNKYVKDMGTLNSSISESARAGFNISLILNENIFSYVNSLPEVVETDETEEPLATDLDNEEDAEEDAEDGETENQPEDEEQPAEEILSSEKRIISFGLGLNPEVFGVIDEANHIIRLDVPYGTDVKNLMTSIISPEATVSPDSDVLQDFTNPVIYQVTAQDGSTQEYEVRVVVASPPEPVKKSGSMLWVIIILVVICVAGAGVFLLIWKNKKK